jgi:hypothetical protein
VKYFLEGRVSNVDQEKFNKLMSIRFNDPMPPLEQHEEMQLNNIGAEEAQQNRARRMDRMKRTADNERDTTSQHAPQYEHYPPQYEFDPNASLDTTYYQQYDQHHGAPRQEDGDGQFHSQYDQYHYQAGV